MNKNYAIFDMDGTLVDSMPYWQRLAEEYLRLKNIRDIRTEVLERIRPMTILEAARYFKEIYHFDSESEDIAREVNELMAEHYREDIPLKPGIKEYLAKLKERNVKMCVASATAEYLMEACLRRLGILEEFEFLLSCETVGAGKHSPEVYYLAAKKLGAEPQDTAIYEDAFHAVQTAKNAGFYVAAVYDENAKENWEEICNLADEKIRNWEDAE
ncbi:MAG TPA: HAD family phosphatase [Candidatus Blautia excrementipullorum]|nr:HAD family phosphatase [Candidatus Blautia excrementipullorum]